MTSPNCQFTTEVDDMVVASGQCCIYLCCYGLEAGTRRRMPEALRRQVVAAFAVLGTE